MPPESVGTDSPQQVEKFAFGVVYKDPLAPGDLEKAKLDLGSEFGSCIAVCEFRVLGCRFGLSRRSRVWVGVGHDY